MEQTEYSNVGGDRSGCRRDQDKLRGCKPDLILAKQSIRLVEPTFTAYWMNALKLYYSIAAVPSLISSIPSSVTGGKVLLLSNGKVNLTLPTGLLLIEIRKAAIKAYIIKRLRERKVKRDSTLSRIHVAINE